MDESPARLGPIAYLIASWELKPLILMVLRGRSQTEELLLLQSSTRSVIRVVFRAPRPLASAWLPEFCLRLSPFYGPHDVLYDRKLSVCRKLHGTCLAAHAVARAKAKTGNGQRHWRNNLRMQFRCAYPTGAPYSCFQC